MAQPLTRADMIRLLARLTGPMRRAFLAAIDVLGQEIDVARIEALLTAGRVQEAIASVDARLVMNGMQPIAEQATYGTIIAAQTATAGLRDVVGFGVAFNHVDTETVTHLLSYSMGLIRQIEGDALASVRAAILQGQREGRNPRDVARDVRSFIGLTERQTQAVMNYRAALENTSANALQRELRDRRFDPSVGGAISAKEPLPQARIDQLVEGYRQRYINLRAETIARTEATRAANSGANLAYRQQIRDGKVSASAIRRQWVFTHDGKTREAHRLIPVMNPNGVGMDEPFKSELGPVMYPGDPLADASNSINCRCAVIHDVDVARMAA